MATASLQDLLDGYEDPLSALRDSSIVDSPTPERQRALEYTNWRDEQRSWKETCYIGDWSFMPDLRVEGPDAKQLWQDLIVNSVENFPIGKAKHAVACNEHGYVIGDGILFRAAEDRYHSQHLAAWPEFNATTRGYDVETEIHDTFIYQVQGPTSLALLESLTDDMLTELPFMNVTEIEIAGTDVYVIRQGMSGEVGFELQGDMEDADEMWETIVEAGNEFGLRRLGRRTHMINHLEMCFPTRGHHYLPAIFGPEMREYREWLDAADLAEANFTIAGSYPASDVSEYYRTPVELNWNRNIAFDHEFVGREALRVEVENPTRSTVTLEWNSEDVVEIFSSLFESGTPHKWMEIPYQNFRAIEGDAVMKDGELVGMSTGRGYSYSFRKMLSLATVDVSVADPGTEVIVVWGEGENPANPRISDHEPKEIRATVATAPYKEDRRRTDLATMSE